MSQLRLAATDRLPDLYRRIRFDTRLESMAFRCLAELDLEGCRSGFARLIDSLDFGAAESRSREVILLLLDILQRVNRRLYRSSPDGAAYHENRAVLVAQFGAYEESEDARQGFATALNRLLAPLNAGAAQPHPLVEGARSYIDENYQRRISLSAVASHLHVSPNYLSRVFKKEAGVNLTSYIHNVRLEHAMILLAAGERSISEIAYLVGYQNYRDFYRNFVKYKHASPRQIQRRLSPKDQDAIPIDGGSR